MSASLPPLRPPLRTAGNRAAAPPHPAAAPHAHGRTPATPTGALPAFSGPIPFLVSYLRRRGAAFAGLLALVIGAASCAVGVQYGMKLIVDAMSTGDRGTPVIWQWLGIFVGLIALESVLWRIGGWIGCRLVVATGVDIRLDLFRHLSGQPMQYFAEHLSGALGNRITATAGATGAIAGTLIWHLLPPVIDFIGAVVVLGSIDARMAFALVGFVAVVGFAITRYGARGRPLHHAYATTGAKVNGELVDVVSNIWTVKAYSAREREYQRLQGALGIESTAQRRSWLYLEKARVLHDLCLWLMAGSMLIWAIHRWRLGIGTAGDVVVTSALTFRILHGSRDFALALVEASQQFGIVGEMLSVIARPHAVADRPGAPAFVARGGCISIRGLRYGYGGERPVFDGFNLEVPAGQRLGIVGPSGAGKSTLIGLLQRLDDIEAGSISIDGQPIAGVQQDSLREALAVVPQEIALLHRPVRDNIRYGRPHADDAAVRAAAREAYCERFIDALPKGYDTIVGERGARLSGGQRQRIGIARAFLKDAPILLLDEATSALDSESEGEIQRALSRLMRGRTVIAIAHRLATVSSFDRIVVIDEGRIVEDGAPEALRAAGGLYARLWRLQAEGAETP